MRFLTFGSISRKLALLVMLAVLPALAILLYSGIEQRRDAIESAKREVMFLTHTMAKTQKETTSSTREILSTLSRLPAIEDMAPQASSEILRAVIKQNAIYNNMALVDLNGDVLASGRTFTQTNLADRKHVRDALVQKKFAVGEYIISRVGLTVPVFAFAYPVLNKEGLPKGVLTAVVKLDSFSTYHDYSNLPDKSFVAITDHRGIRLSYYPPQEETNPVGKPIKTKSWEIASKTQEPGMFVSAGSDGLRRIFSFEQVRFNTGGTPYLYVWAGIPEDHILKPANAILARNLLLMAMVTVLALLISWLIGRNTEALIEKLKQALKEIKTLRGILPICSVCKKIRNDQGYYEQIEGYIHKHSGVDFSHTICPECADEMYAGQDWYEKGKKNGSLKE